MHSRPPMSLFRPTALDSSLDGKRSGPEIPCPKCNYRFLSAAGKRKVANGAGPLTFLNRGKEVHESAYGTSRHFAAVQQPGRSRSKADINFDASCRRVYEYTTQADPPRRNLTMRIKKALWRTTGPQ